MKHDKSEQTDITPEEFELDDCLLESNDIVITQNKDGFVLHVKKLGNITTAKIGPTDDDQTVATSVTEMNTQAQITDVQNITDVKPTLTTLTTSPIKLPSSECGESFHLIEASINDGALSYVMFSYDFEKFQVNVKLF